MKTTTSTQVTHYEIQKKRRESLLEEWRGYRKTIVKRSDVQLVDVPGLIKNANAQKFWTKPASGEFTKLEELDGSILVGTPDDIVQGVRRYQEIGCDLLVFDFRMRFPDWLQQIETLAREVLPRVSEPAAAVR